ncbi:hypothetical protein [Scytonema sp. PCC 10023]|uniref:hypothetical protein n=1 Tax=Scytonema sp. PCC 10023 TaxID=1680591 RepID=UPI0039C5D873
MTWSKEEAQKRDLLPLVADAIGWAAEKDYKRLEGCLREAFTAENLKISMLRHEKARIIREMKAALAANGYQESAAIDSVVDRLRQGR